MSVKEGFENEGLVKFDFLKSLIQNKCIIQKDISVYEQPADDEEDWNAKKKNSGPIKVISMVVKSKDNEFMSLLTESSEKDQDSAIEIFLKRYYKQEDVEMKDLKANQIKDPSRLATSLFEGELFDMMEANEVTQKIEKKEKKPKKVETKKGGKTEPVV